MLFTAVSLSAAKQLLAQEGRPVRVGIGPQQVDGLYQIPQEAKRDRAFYFTQDTFDPHLNTDFTVRAGVLVSTLRLIEVAPCGSGAELDVKATGSAGECFSLTFRADKELSEVRTIHVFEHGALGEFSLFVAPTKSSRDPQGLYYVAVINHRLDTGVSPAARTPATARPQEPRRRPLF